MPKRRDERRRLLRTAAACAWRKQPGRKRRTGTAPCFRQCRFEQFEPRMVLATPIAPTSVLAATAIVGNDLDWFDGTWGVKVTGQGTPGSALVRVDLPDGTFDTGNALEVYYAFSAADVSQISVFLTDGFWRQVSHGGPWGTSYRLFRYRASNDQDCDRLLANHFQAVGVNPEGKLRLQLDYDNDSAAGDQFDVHADVLLEPPGPSASTMTASITVTNASGREVTPSWDGHRQLAEQWELFGLSSMYVADNLTGGLPGWYDGLDPAHDYVGVTNDADYLNDGFSVNGQLHVSTHDVKRLVADSSVVELAHDEAACPHVVVAGYEWYDQLVMRDEVATQVRLEHLYQSSRNQEVRLLSAGGITSTVSDLEWAATYNRTDTNMVDGDNIQVKLGMDDLLNAWPAGASQTVELRLTAGGFPFSMSDGLFWRGGQPVFLNVLGYQPLEPGQSVDSPISLERVRDDLRRWQDYQGGGDPVLLRVYAQPTPAHPVRMPQEFYDGVRQLGFWILRDIFVPEDIGSPDVLDRARQSVDAVLNEVLAVGGTDRIFAWEIGNEFLGVNDYPALTTYLTAVRDYLKQRLQEPAFAGASNWVTWATYPGKDLLRTDGNRVSVPWDYYSINVYPYDPERIRDHQPGPRAGTPYEGYLTALLDQAQREFPGAPLVVTEAGLSDYVDAVADGVQDRLHPWYPVERKGGLNDQQVAEGLTDVYMAARLSDRIAGLGFFEWNDELWKAGDPSQQNHAEEAYGLGRFEALAGGGYELRNKLQQEAVRDLFTLDFHAEAAFLTGLAADAASVPLGGSTMVRATVDPLAPGPVRFRWESSRGRIVGDSATVQFFAGNVDLGPAAVTCVAIDALGRAHVASTSIAIQTGGSPAIEIFTSGPAGLSRVSGRVANVDLARYKVVLYIEIPGDQQYVQPYGDAPFVFAGIDGYWWTQAHKGATGEVIAWVVPRDFVAANRPAGSPPPPGTIAEARRSVNDVDDTDNDLQRDDWELQHFGNLNQDRYGDPDGDRAYNLEEFLAGIVAMEAHPQFVGGGSPSLSDNDEDGSGGAGDGVPDNWEYQMFRTLAFAPGDDPDGDGMANSVELDLGIHPGRTAPDSDQDGLPDRWERRWFGSLAPQAADDPNGDGLSNLAAYELALPPQSYFHTEGRDIVRDATGEKLVFRGVNLTGLEYGTFFDYPYPGALGTDYFQPRPVDFEAVQARGFNLVRVPFEWARLLPGWEPGDPLPVGLETNYLALLDAAVDMAGQHGLYVILDMHDFLKYWSGQGAQAGVNDSLPHQQLLAYTWRLLAGHFAASPTVLGYDLMNEPVREAPGSSHWHAISQQLVEAIRQEDRNHLVFVEGPNYSLTSFWPVDNAVPWITDAMDPARVVYSPHVYFDYDNNSLYDGPGEQTAPAQHWEYYVRDRLMPAVDWSIEANVPIFIGETGAPSTPGWSALMDEAFRCFFEPLHLSVAAWQYIDPIHCPTDPMNLPRFPVGGLLDTLDDFPGGTYLETLPFRPVPHDSLIYDDQRVNPWQDDGSWGAVVIDPSAASPVCTGQYSLSVQFQEAWAGAKFLHQFGLETSGPESNDFQELTFWIYPTSSDLDFAIFTTGPLPSCTEYPAGYEDRPRLTDYLPGPLVTGEWQLVRVPLADIVDPANSVITGIAIQNDSRPSQPTFYLDDVRLGRLDLVPPTLLGWTLTEDTGASDTDRITKDAAPMLTFSFSEFVIGNDDISIIGPDSGSIEADSIAGWGTDTLTVAFSTPLVLDGQYTVTLKGASTIRDTSGNPLNGGADEVVHFSLDTAGPIITVVPLGTADRRPQITGTLDASIAGLSALSVTVHGAAYHWPDDITVEGTTWTLPDDTITPALVAGTYDVAVVATDLAGNTASDGTSGELTIYSSVAARNVFYNNCRWDAHTGFTIGDPAANEYDDNAIATDKVALLPGGTGALANYTSYLKGINGIMVDIDGLPGFVTAADFQFLVGNANSLDLWTPAPAPASVTVRPGAGVSGSDRVTVIWAGGTIKNQWLQVTVLGPNTGLAENDVHYWGNQVGETGNNPANTRVDAGDASAVRAHYSGLGTVAVTSRYDINRDKRVDAGDFSAIRANYTGLSPSLIFLAAPMPRPAGLGGTPVEAMLRAAPDLAKPPASLLIDLLAANAGAAEVSDRATKRSLDMARGTAFPEAFRAVPLRASLLGGFLPPAAPVEHELLDLLARIQSRRRR